MVYYINNTNFILLIVDNDRSGGNLHEFLTNFGFMNFKKIFDLL